jgi:hypothetical protein
MLRRLLALLPFLTGAGAYADTLPVPQSLAPAAQAKSPGTKVADLQRLLAPAISVTRVTRQRDGSLSIDCVQRPNPKLRLPGAPVSPRNGGAQP